MPTRILIRHLTGSKVNQVEQFPIESFTELSIGRDREATIHFDPMRDDAVSRKHALIQIASGDPPSFRLSDLGSSNGTWLNGDRIASETELLPGDTIELGNGGPKLGFDVEPRPSNLVARTRVINTAGAAATRIIDAVGDVPLAAATTAETQPERVTRASVGKNTVMRMLSAERRAANRVGLYAVAGVLAVVGIVAGLVYYKTQTDVAEQSAQFAQQSAAQASRNDELATRVQQQQKQMGLSPAEVVEKFANATVFVRLQWRLYDRETGKPLFQKVLTVPTEDGSVSLPCYVKIGDKYHRWLTTDDEDKKNIRVGGAGSATGFVINDQGLIITNKHVAAGWLVNYWAYSRAEKGQGLLFEAQARPIPQDKFVRVAKTPSRIFNMISNQNKFQQLLDWHPNAGGPVFANSQPVLMGNDEHTFEGRNEELSVRFPGSRVDVEARLLRASADADAALIKIDATHALTTIPIAAGDEVKEGERVTVLGYPSFTAENVAIVTTTEGGELRRNKEVIPQPTVTEGNISNISLPVHQIGAVTIAGAMGHAYQLTVPSWHGNSGGPVFNADGQVIALYTYGSTRETVTYAVPIMYARDLLKMQRSF